MPIRHKYFVKIKNQLVEVEKTIYEELHQTKRRALYLSERDVANGVFSYHSQDIIPNLNEDITGEETLYDNQELTPEDFAIRNIYVEKLNIALKSLSQDEMELIIALFFDMIGERRYAQILDISQPSVNKRKKKILLKLKKIIKKL